MQDQREYKQTGTQTTEPFRAPDLEAHWGNARRGHDVGRIPIQAKLTVGPTRDRYEDEASRIARQIALGFNAPKNLLHYDLRLTDSKSNIQQMSRTDIIGTTIAPELQARLRSAREGGESLEPSIRTLAEKTLGFNFGRVKIHTGTQADSLNHQLESDAFTIGQDIFFRRNAYLPQTLQGRELLAHELTHVVQQHGRASFADAHGANIQSSGEKANLIQRGRLSGSIRDIGETWNTFKARTGEIDTVLANRFVPLLTAYTKAGGVSGKGTGGKPTKPAQMNFPNIFLPEKDAVINIAEGVAHWVVEATEGADRYYGEMRWALDRSRPASPPGQPLQPDQPLRILFGTDTTDQPDFTVMHSNSTISNESKSIISDNIYTVDLRIREARAQNTLRVMNPILQQPYDAWNIVIEIKNPNNTWPFTPKQHKSPWNLAVTNGEVGQAITGRNLKPQKKRKYLAVPPSQQGKHKLHVRWIRDQTTVRQIEGPL